VRFGRKGCIMKQIKKKGKNILMTKYDYFYEEIPKAEIEANRYSPSWFVSPNSI
jgi:hypothetical protein